MGQIILIAGPTASGKSALAAQLAEQLHGVIINTDSMQVYRDLHIITARPTPDEEKRLPHRLYGHVDAAAAARLKPGDRARITRALEVVLATGRSLTDWHGDNKPAGVDIARAAKVFLMPDRDELGRRIDVRFDTMMAGGALDEVRALA